MRRHNMKALLDYLKHKKWRLTFWAHKTPANINMLVIPTATPGGEVIRADDAVRREDLGSGSEAEVIGMVSHWTAHTTHQPT